MGLEIGVIGNGKMAVDCMKHMLSFDDVVIPFAIYQPAKDPQLAVENFSKSLNIETKVFGKINAEDSLQYIQSKEPDYILSINNFRILGSDLLKIPAKGIINFHNGPLPAYGGVNIPSWAIINGEKAHGVTWHFVNEGIDTGDIIAQKLFDIDEDSTAARLMTISIGAGLKLFKEFFPDLVNGELKRIPQQGKSNYYSLKDIPENNGVISLNWDYNKISSLVRGLNFIPYPTDFVSARIVHNGKSLILNDVSITSENTEKIPSGFITRINDSEFGVACSDSIINLDTFLNDDMDEVSPIDAAEFFMVKEGDIL